ncbi:MAG TPA: phosphodiester glycosidase family protein [Thermoanaerobaculia bacterium]|nr:phosphodiester glycosidase family protein [Thermoanaerobaculia bacterium]
MKFAFIALLVAAACHRETPAPTDPAPAETAKRCVEEWTRAAEGLEYRTLDCELHLVRVDPHRASIDAVVRPGSTAGDLGKTYDFAINANFFDQQFRPLGVVLSNGRALNPVHPVRWQSVFYVDRKGRPGIVPVREWEGVRESAKTAVQCGPRLVVDGKRNDVARADPTWRSGVCIDREERVVFFATDPDARFDVHQMVDLAADRLQCRDAMLFDGGPSVQMFLRRDGEPVHVEGDKRVPAYVVVKTGYK